MWWLFFILFLLISIISSTLLFYALRRINQYENYLTQIQQIIEISSEKLKKIDHTGHFQSDDEVGFMFEQMKDIQSLLSELITLEGERNDTDGDKVG
tara:strand:- start:549 stop:839 length:291 start_codon:yes stop_codon:yes gene_type:complete